MPSKTRIKNLKPSNFETIDAALLDWVENILDIHTTTNEGWKKVPVFWLTAERAAQRQKRRDTFSDALIFPMISIERADIQKTAVNQRPIPGNLFPVNDYRGGAFTIHRRIHQQKTKNFANADSFRLNSQYNFPTPKNQKIVYQTISVPMPVYYDISYTINVRTDYQQQMNEIMQPFMVYAGGINQFILEKDGYSYEAFLEDTYSLNNNISSLDEEEKKYETTIKIKVLGFIVGADKNQDSPKMAIREGPVELKFQREQVILGDINEYGEVDGKDKEPLRPRHKESNPLKK
tara:strand:+ start:5031 stop:5903 length:873 start_codon:yes stop_codon:yes gene_type:complete